MGSTLTLWTIRLSLVLYAWALFRMGGGAGEAGRAAGRGRRLWTAACLLFLVHVGCAFQYFHAWSHAEAVADTARQTRELLGFALGEGIYFSYLFAAVWLADVLWWWLDAASYAARRPLVHGLIHGYLGFIAFQGAVVFEAGPTRWGGLAVALTLGARELAMRLRRRQAGGLLPEPEPECHESASTRS